jgi:hypothetical protein
MLLPVLAGLIKITAYNTVNIVKKLVTVFAGYQPLKKCILTIYRDTSVAQLCIS